MDFRPYGIKISQTPLQVITHLEIIERFGVTLFVELGVLEGGLAAIILPRIGYTSRFCYFGVEINTGPVDAQVQAEILARHSRARLIEGDCFDRVVVQKVFQAIQDSPGPAYIFCDNGDKPRELKIYSQLLRTGDLISAHDYPNEIDDRDLIIVSERFEEVEPEKFRGKAQLPLFRKL